MTMETYCEESDEWCDVCICSDQIVVLDRPLAVMTKVQEGDKRAEDGAGLILSSILVQKFPQKQWPRLRARPPGRPGFFTTLSHTLLTKFLSADSEMKEAESGTGRGMEFHIAGALQCIQSCELEGGHGRESRGGGMPGMCRVSHTMCAACMHRVPRSHLLTSCAPGQVWSRERLSSTTDQLL